MIAEERRFGPVWFLPGEDRGRYPNCHSIFLAGPGVLFDPASDRHRLSLLKEEERVNMIFLTHWHEDHFRHLDLFPEVPVWISREDAPALSDLEVFLDFYGVEREERPGWRGLITGVFNYRPRVIENYLTGGAIFDFGIETVEVISAPGHTPGHLAFKFGHTGILFLGDYDLSRFGPWYGDTDSSIEQTIKSLKFLRSVEASRWLSCHEQGVFEENPGGLWEAYENVIYERERKLLNLLERPQTLDSIVNAWIIYGRPKEPREFFKFGERGHMLKHLERLIKAGSVKREGESFERV